MLRAVEASSAHTFELTDDLVGGAAIDAFGTAMRNETVALAKRSDAVLFGAVGGPKWDDPKATVRPEQAILGLRTALGTFANLRPARMQPALVHLSPLKPEIVQGADVLFVRELVAGTYFARPKKYWQDARGIWRAVDTTRLYRAAGRAHRAHGLRARPRPPQAPARGRQAERHGHLAAVARRRDARRRRTSRTSSSWRS